MFDGVFAPSHIVIVAILFVLLFGYKKLPDASKSIARSLRIFKSEMKDFHGEDEAKETDTPAAPVVQSQLPPAAPVAPVAPVVQTPAAPVAAPVKRTRKAAAAPAKAAAKKTSAKRTASSTR